MSDPVVQAKLDALINVLSTRLDSLPSRIAGELGGVQPAFSSSIVSSGQSGQAVQINEIADKGTIYTRMTHPKLFEVVDLLDGDRDKRMLSVRDLAFLTGVSKSWCAVAKRYWQVREVV